MSPIVAIVVYSCSVLLALSLLYKFHATRWYWHAVSVAVALVLGLLPMSVFGQPESPRFDLLFGFLLVFLLFWGIGGIFFRVPRHPVHH